jgi:hypothetical protein
MNNHQYTFFFRVLKQEIKNQTVVWAPLFKQRRGESVPREIPTDRSPDLICLLVYKGIHSSELAFDFLVTYRMSDFPHSRRVYADDIRAGYVAYSIDEHSEMPIGDFHDRMLNGGDTPIKNNLWVGGMF